MSASLELTRAQILGFRRRANALDQRLPNGPDGLRTAAWAGLTDSMPRAALLSLHARVTDVGPSAWGDPPLVQIWGPRFSVYVVMAQDQAIFTVGRMPDDAEGRDRAEHLAARLREHLVGDRRRYDEVGRELGVNPNALRYATTTGTVLIRWEGSGRPVLWTVDRPALGVREARRELLRPHLHVAGPSTVDGFTRWAGITRSAARMAFASLDRELVAVKSPIGEGRILASDEPAMRQTGPRPEAVRLLPSGDAYFLCWGTDRELLVADPARRGQLWTSRVWPGAVLIDGEIRGVWRRSDATLTVSPWGRPSAAQRASVEAEAAALPLPGLRRAVEVVWE